MVDPKARKAKSAKEVKTQSQTRKKWKREGPATPMERV